MKLIDRLVLKELLPNFALGVAMFFTLWFAGDPLLKAGQFLNEGVPLALVAQLVSWNIPFVLSLTLPMGMLMSVLQGYGRLSGDSEAVVLSASGVPFARIAAPAIAFGLVASIIGYGVNDRVEPYAQQQVANLTNNIRSSLGQEGETTRPLDFPVREHNHLQFLVHAEKGFDLSEKALRQVTITQFDLKGNPTAIFHAEKARWEQGNNWELMEGQGNSLGQNMAYFQVMHGKTFDLHKSLQSTSFLDRDPATLDFHDLRRQIGLLKAEGTASSDPVLLNAEVSLWGKIAIPFSALVFAFVGSPLGLQSQRKSRVPGPALAILIVFAYYVSYETLTSIASSGHLSPMLAAFLPNIVGLAVGAVLVWKASR